MAEPEQTPAEDIERAAVVEAREAAWQAWVDTVSPPETDPEHPALHETHTGGQLFQLLDRAIHDYHYYGATARYLPDSNVEVQSITFPDDSVAWLETCEVADVEQLNRLGEVMSSRGSGTGTYTRQLTEVMRREGGIWKLAESIVNRVDEGIADCEFGDGSPGAGSDVYSEEFIASAREAAEKAMVDLLVPSGRLDSNDLERVSNTHTGHLLSIYTALPDRGVGYYKLSSSTTCVLYPGSGGEKPAQEYSDELYALFDKYWEEEWGQKDTLYGHAPDACSRRTNTVIPINYKYNQDSHSEVVVNSVTMQDDENPSVAYINTCRVHEFEIAGGPHENHLGPAIVHATESMRLEDDTWKLANRWDISIEEDLSMGCDEREGA